MDVASPMTRRTLYEKRQVLLCPAMAAEMTDGLPRGHLTSGDTEDRVTHSAAESRRRPLPHVVDAEALLETRETIRFDSCFFDTACILSRLGRLGLGGMIDQEVGPEEPSLPTTTTFIAYSLGHVVGKHVCFGCPIEGKGPLLPPARSRPRLKEFLRRGRRAECYGMDGRSTNGLPEMDARG